MIIMKEWRKILALLRLLDRRTESQALKKYKRK